MEFENVNNVNFALEAAAKKKSRRHLTRSLAHLFKKMLRRAKPVCCSVPSPASQEELDNAANEALEYKLFTFEFDAAPERDLRRFNYITEFQVATRQS